MDVSNLSDRQKRKLLEEKKMELETARKRLEAAKKAAEDAAALAMQAQAEVDQAEEAKEKHGNVLDEHTKTLKEEVEKTMKDEKEREATLQAAVEKFKFEGNAAFQAKRFDIAVACYTQALEFAENDPRMLSNRSASYAGAGKYEEALADAEQCVTVASDWVKGYWRKGKALLALKREGEALTAFRAGLEIEPNNRDLQDMVRKYSA
eukprot:GFYU01008357.1.p1 GENE.GFYU01008357.1~~GFYU01008357.1.p1  ORF type:complete len:207 (+),score=56.56 GFYU01008357.1:38-658(+)